jgi:hypothetical protein
MLMTQLLQETIWNLLQHSIELTKVFDMKLVGDIHFYLENNL